MKRLLLTFSLIAGLAITSFAGEASMFSGNDMKAVSIVEVGEAWEFGQEEGTVMFYPNPVKDYLNVKFPSRGNYTVRIFNIVGEKITEKTISDDYIIKINLSELQSGMYFISYEFGGKVVTKTFSKAE